MHNDHPRFAFSGLFLLVLILICALTGCTTTPESDVPWNVPQPWEGSPSLGGMNQQ